MSYAPNYTPTTSFADDETNQASGRSTVRTASLDREFADIEATADALNDNLKQLQRDDGKLRDLLIEPYAISEQLRAMIVSLGRTPRGAWAINTDYKVGDLVQRNAIAYMCQTAHNSGPEFNPGFWMSISGDGSAATSAEQAQLNATLAAASAALATADATSAAVDALAAAAAAVDAAASALAAQNSADSIAGLSPVNLTSYMLGLLANSTSAAVRAYIGTLASVDLASQTDVAKGAALVGFSGRTAREKLLEWPSFEDAGAKGDGTTNDLASLQAALNKSSAVSLDRTYRIPSAVTINSLSTLHGSSAGIAMTGAVANFKHGIQKIGHATTAVTNFQTSVVTNVDAIAVMNPAWLDGGASYPQKASIDGQSFQGDPTTPTDMGLYIEQAGGLVLREVDFSAVTHGVYAKEAWLTLLERVHTLGKITWKGGTSVHFDSCWTGDGYDLTSTIYSAITGSGSDGASNTAYKLDASHVALIGVGSENATTITADTGTALALKNNSSALLGVFDVVPRINQVIALKTLGAGASVFSAVSSSSFGVPGVNCPDWFVDGSNATGYFFEDRSWNGTKNLPVIQFKAGVTNSRLIYHYDGNIKTFYTDGAGNTLTDSFKDQGTFAAALQIGGASTGITTSLALGTWSKLDNFVRITFEIVLTSKGVLVGALSIGGWPLFISVGTAAVQFSQVLNITGGPFAGLVNAGGSDAVILLRGATGDTNATNANLTNTSTIRGEILLQLARPYS